MDWILLTLSILLLLLGIIGCFIPVIPGPPLSFAGLLILEFTQFANFEIATLIVFGILSIVVQILDFMVPIWGTKRFGGTKAGVWGSTIGLIAGLFILPAFGPFGILTVLAGPFIGAYIGEKMAGQHSEKALRAATGSFIGFLAGTFMKLALSLTITVYFIVQLFE